MNPKLCKTLAAVAAIATAVAAHSGPTGTTAPTQVTVMNPNSAPVPVKAAVGAPFVRTFNLVIPAADYNKFVWDTWTVPAGKRAVIEHVSTLCGNSAPVTATQFAVQLGWNEPNSIGSSAHYLDGTSRIYGGSSTWIASQALRFHLPAGGILSMVAMKSDTASSANCYMTVSGLITDAS